MAASVDWPTSVITVPLSDLTLISGNRYSYDVFTKLHFELRTLHASEDGGVYPKTHDHKQNTLLAGIDYADSVEILAPYTIEFEDGQRQVVLTGANHNLSDKQVVNQVGLITQNSAGLINATLTQPEIRDAMKLAPSAGLPAAGSIDSKLDLAAHMGAIWLDPNNGNPGTVVGVNGTPDNPVDTLADLETLADTTGFRTAQILTGTITLDRTFTEWTFIGHAEVEINFGNQNVNGSVFSGALLKGQIASGRIAVFDADLEDVTNFGGIARRSGYGGTITFAAGLSIFHHCYSLTPGSGLPIFDLVDGNRLLSLRGVDGGAELRNSTSASNAVTLDMNSGQVILASTVTEGDIVVRGIAKLQDLGSASPDIAALLPRLTGIAARASLISDNASPDNLSLMAWLERQGQPITTGLVSATAVLIEAPSGTVIFGTPTPLAMSPVPGTGAFALSIPTTALADATNYLVILTVTDAEGAVTAYQAQPTLAAA